MTMNSIEDRLATVERVVPQAKTMADGIAALVDATQKAIERHNIDASKLDALERKIMQCCTAQEFAGYGQGANERMKRIESELAVHRQSLLKLTAGTPNVQGTAQFVIVYGSLGAGITIVGPFSTHDAARSYLVTEPDGAVIAEIIMLQSPAP